MRNEILNRWTVEEARELYGIRNWSAGYFDISADGNVVVTPNPKRPDVSVSIKAIIEGMRERGLTMPVLLRIENLLVTQLALLHDSFRAAMSNFDYKGDYRGVYPIKVNQQQQVIEAITRFGRSTHHGLEVGSKAELIAAISMLNDKEACLICNGYKDEEFIDLALYAVKMGYKCFLVVEMPSELPMIVERSKKVGVKPNIGVRLKLSTKAGGHWTESGGDRSIFGLNISQLIEAVDYLKDNGMLECLKLLHYHLGSQIPNIRDIRSAVTEGCRYYAEMVKEGAPMGYLDIGGGLAVDYDGSKTNFVNSMNYTLEEYCVDIIEVIISILGENNIAHPTIVTESGRATVAYSSILLVNVLDIAKFEIVSLPEQVNENSHELMKNLHEVLKSMTLKNIQECYNDAIYYRDEIRQLFKHGEITLRERSVAENIFWNIMNIIYKERNKMSKIPPELEGIESALADIYYCNFSVFQSLPDSWAIGHLFPIMPIHRLNEEPLRQATIADVTCDCDGKIDKFIDLHDVRNTLPMHDLIENEEYYLGVFLVGAYQETLGDLHNLMGDTNIVSVHIYEDGTYDFVREIDGDSVADVLSYVEYDPKTLMTNFRSIAEQAVKDGFISPAERRQIIKKYESGLSGYTYFER
ncbi:MAG: arginine decarboxylase [Deltaproteobacteria bacterium CG_4_8_14_3_um_filter_51_11]|nr:biosynthetic arginine decarboxylase [bacterium]OIP42776.1 MAG: arginine decarboxylase [Desulfobacteraceae bacterium CG2_30_51_40]PIP46669.1 MAG: arginine decarboxylase [Deltaproteobacteria bacterium CG23_combo_of_CG06-09_8_20_14_all_51_20]PIX18715.1 MAG: arginine decarboxylase [Deltaproteobacteria bacterium CG_4_8_14_3_um_filter_51_11]PIY22729.1 MAG: arginine decarboxylase [Deltaproteobacteria bacterium CG_4_10_14_3_um_filter_51_14]PJB34663.1 MAG: arginine decarboxylase [Deltaproteobacteria